MSQLRVTRISKAAAGLAMLAAAWAINSNAALFRLALRSDTAFWGITVLFLLLAIGGIWLLVDTFSKN